MANNNLLTGDDFAEIRDVLNDTMFTFLKLDVVYKLDSNTATRWMKDIHKKRVYTDINLKGLVVWNSDASQENKSTNTGSYDYGEGYVMIRYDDMLDADLIDADKNLALTPPQDKIVFNNVEYYITCIIKAGQLESTDVMVKIYFRKQLKSESE